MILCIIMNLPHQTFRGQFINQLEDDRMTLKQLYELVTWNLEARGRVEARKGESGFSKKVRLVPMFCFRIFYYLAVKQFRYNGFSTCFHLWKLH